MSYEYAMSRVHDALEKSEGNHLKAQRMLVNMAENDHTLLLGLVKQHLQGIITHALDTATKDSSRKMPRTVDVDGKTKETDPKTPTKASQKHIDAIYALAKASKSSDKE